MDFCVVYITTADREEAERIGVILVEERLAACVNILDGMTSTYWWEGKMETAQECVLIAKTKSALVNPLKERVKQLHSYSCPCIIALPIQDGNPDYLEWVRKETK